jgi:sigma-B regulation protein RsbU (phosphoserine phosphatase)
MIRTIIHLVAHQPGMSVNRILDIVNWGIAGKVSLDRFATMAMLTYDFASHRLEYSNAAHHPLLIYRAATASFEALDTEGIPIGLEKKTKYNRIDTVLQPDDIVLLYTDGIIEAMNDRGEQYSLESLETVMRTHCALPPERLKKAIIEDMNRFVGKAKQHDDQTFLLMKVDG